MKTKIIPFDLEMAEKIQAGEIEGKIVTQDNEPVRIVCFDKKSTNKRETYQVVALVEINGREYLIICGENGLCWDGEDDCNRSLHIELPEETPKTQADLCEEWWLEEQKRKPYIKQLLKLKDYTEQLMEVNQGVIDDLDNLVQDLRRICEPPEQKHEFKAGDKVRIHCEGDQYDNKIGEVVDVLTNVLHVRVGALPFPYKINKVEFIAHGRVDNSVNSESSKHEFKPFDKVLVRDNDNSEWNADFYSHVGNDGRYICVSCGWKQCIPYEGNQELVGTTDKPKEE